MVTLVTKTPKEGMQMRNMKDGEIAVILDERYAGQVVQMIGEDKVITIGGTQGKAWNTANSNTLRVRLLETGELIEVTQ